MNRIINAMKANGDYDSICEELGTMFGVMANASTSPQDFKSNIDEASYNTALSMSDDGSSRPLTPSDVNVSAYKVSQVMFDGTPKSQEAINDEVVARAEVEMNKSSLKSWGSLDAPATPQYVANTLGTCSLVSDTSQVMTTFNNNLKSETKKTKKLKQYAIAKQNTDYSNTYKKVSSIVKEPVDWGQVLSKEAQNPEDAFNRLREFITNKIEEKYGGWSRITSIVVRDSCLVINNTMYVPVIESKYINADIFPLDTLNYIKEGKLAYLFNWKSLKMMNNLYSVDIDDASFYVTTVGADLGFSRSIGVVSIFRSCRSLKVFTLGNETITRDNLNKPESAPIKTKVDTTKRFMNFSDGYSLNIYAGTNGIQSYMLNNLRQYATNRGNKGLFRFCTGTLVRAGLFTSAGVVNLATHMIGGVLSAMFSGKY